MHLPEIDKYSYIPSFFSSWNPPLKLLGGGFLIIIFSLLSNIYLCLLSLGLSLFFFFISKLPFSFLFKQLRWLLLLLIFFLIILPLTVEGESFNWGLLTFSKQGLNLAFLISLRALSIFILLVVILGTTKFNTVLKALGTLKVPNKFIQMVMFTYRYIFLFWEELRRVTISAKSRLFKERTDYFTFKIFANLVGILFIRGWERTQEVYQAMLSRGYKGKIESLEEFKFGLPDILKTFLLGSVGLSLIILNWAL